MPSLHDAAGAVQSPCRNVHEPSGVTTRETMTGGVAYMLAARDIHGRTPLHWVAEENPEPSVVEVLIEAGANPNAFTDNGMRPFDYAKALRGTEVY